MKFGNVSTQEYDHTTPHYQNIWERYNPKHSGQNRVRKPSYPHATQYKIYVLTVVQTVDFHMKQT